MKKILIAICVIGIMGFTIRVINAGSGVVGIITQPVSGTVAVNGSTVAVTNMNGASLSVTFPSAQSVNAAISGSIGNTSFAATQSGAWTITGTTVAVVGLNGAAIPVSMSGATSTPLVSTRACTNSDFTLMPANATRKGLEIDTECGNTDSVFISFGAVAATVAMGKELKPCTNWQAPPGVVVVSIVHVISGSGTQGVRVVEYP